MSIPLSLNFEDLFTLIGNILAFIAPFGIWQAIKFLKPDIDRHLQSRRKAREYLYDNLDSLLKASDELYGKITSLAKEDFATFINEKNSISNDVEQNKKYFKYLISQFWSRLEYLRRNSEYNSLARLKKGKELLRFIETFESRSFRLLDRSIQRIIGESLLDSEGKSITLFQYVNELNTNNSDIKNWSEKLDNFFKGMKNGDKDIKQQILIFGVIVSILIDHFDPNNKVIRTRKDYNNKLSTKSKKRIRNDLLQHYLKFVSYSEKYWKQTASRRTYM